MTSPLGVPRLVVVDMQEIFRRTDSGWAVPRFDVAARAISRLLPLFGDDVVLTRFVAPPRPTGAWIDYYRRWPFALLDENDPSYALTTDFSDLGHDVVSMSTFGKWGSELATAMRGSQDMVLTGVSTDCCVLATALGAADAGVRVRVVVDACAGVSDADHERALAIMAPFAPIIEMTTVDEVLSELSTLGEREHTA